MTAEIPAEPARASASTSSADLRIVDVVTERFFERLADRPLRRLVIVLDSDRPRLRQHQAIDDPARRRFIERARAHGAIVVDAEPLDAEHFARSSLSLDVGPYDGHMNPLGLAIVMQPAAEALRATAP
jgi:hypothetical protein